MDVKTICVFLLVVCKEYFSPLPENATSSRVRKHLLVSSQCLAGAGICIYRKGRPRSRSTVVAGTLPYYKGRQDGIKLKGNIIENKIKKTKLKQAKQKILIRWEKSSLDTNIDESINFISHTCTMHECQKNHDKEVK